MENWGTVESSGSEVFDFDKSGQRHELLAPREHWIVLTEIRDESGVPYNAWIILLRGLRHVVGLSLSECSPEPFPLRIAIPPRQSFGIEVKEIEGPQRIRLTWRRLEREHK
jgi:hypothetical protein